MFKQLQGENAKLKRLVAELSLDKVMLQDVLSKKNLRPAQKRIMVDYLCTAYPISERRARRTVRCARATYQYQSHRDPPEALRMHLRERAEARMRFGY